MTGMTLLVVLLSSILFIVLPGGMVSAEERTPVRGGNPSSTRDQQGGLADAATVVAERLAAAFPRIEGLVIGFEGDRVLIDRGTAAGVLQGMQLDVFREGQEFKHPLTGEVLGKLDKDLGMIRILHVHERYAEAAVLKKTEKTGFRKGDRVRVSMARMIVAFPNVDVEGISGVSSRSTTRDLAAALVRTGRFELVEERQLRSILLIDKAPTTAELADPRLLKELSDRGKIQALLLSRLTPSTDGASLDVQVYSTLTGNPIVFASAQVQSGLVPRGQPPRDSQPSSAARPAVKTPSESTGQAANTSRAASGKPSVISAPLGHVVLEPVFDGPMTALAVADLDGDGKNELLVTGTDRLAAFRLDGLNLRPLADYPLGGKGAVTTLEAIDVTGDGSAEVILTLSHKGRSHALVIQLTDGKLRSIWETPDLTLRSLSSNGKTPQLFGQAMASREPIPPPIRQYVWDGQQFNAGPALDVPAGFLLPEFMIADLGGDGAVRLVTLKGGTILEVRTHAGELITTYQVSEAAMAVQDRRFARILIDKKRSGEGPYLVVGREREASAGLLRSWIGNKAVSLAVLKWDGTGFQEVREIPISEGTLADYAVADLGEGLGRRLLALIVKSGRLGLGKKSEIQAFSPQ